MIRKAFRMSIHPDAADEYARRHQPIWAELEDVLIRHGVVTYSIFLDRSSNDLFAYVEFESEQCWADVARTDVCQRWWAYMRDIMPANADGSPVSVDLCEVFHIDRRAPAPGP